MPIHKECIDCKFIKHPADAPLEVGQILVTEGMYGLYETQIKSIKSVKPLEEGYLSYRVHADRRLMSDEETERYRAMEAESITREGAVK